MISDPSHHDPRTQEPSTPQRMTQARVEGAPVRAIVAATLLALLVLAVLLAGSPARAQVSEQGGPTSVALVPSSAQPDDPHHGTWFVMTLAPGESGRQVATIVNPTNAPKVVDLDIRHVEFTDGQLRLAEDATAGLGGWGQFEQQRVTVPPRDRVQVPFILRVPESGVEPRDYVGAAVATTSSTVGTATVVQQVATRIYVTVPGETSHKFEVANVATEVDSMWWPRTVLVTVTLRNEGRIRIAPTVTIAGQEARGPRFVLSGTEEQFLVDLPAPLVAGSLSLPVDVSDDTGTTRRVNAGTVVVRWGFLIALLAVSVAGGLSVRWWRRHESRYAQLERDMRRLERLVASMRGPAQAAGAGDASTAVHDVVADVAGGEHQFHAALKRARRTGDHEALARLALARHADSANTEALTLLLEAIKKRTSHHPALAQAAASYGTEALEEAMEGIGLSESTRRMLYGLARTDEVVLADR